MDTARVLLDGIIDDFGAKAPGTVSRLEAGFEDAIAVTALRQCLRKRLQTTSSAERLNEETRRRERVIGIFPNDESAVRLIGAVLMKIDEAWSTGRRYLNTEEY